MDNKYNLIITNDIKSINEKENLFFLKKTYGSKINSEIFEDYNEKTFNQNSYSREQIIKESEICEQIFKSIFKDLTVGWRYCLFSKLSILKRLFGGIWGVW